MPRVAEQFRLSSASATLPVSRTGATKKKSKSTSNVQNSTTSSNNKRREPDPVTPRTKKARKAIVNEAAIDYMNATHGKRRKETYRKSKEFVEKLQRTHPWITKDQITSRATTIRRKEDREVLKKAAALAARQEPNPTTATNLEQDHDMIVEKEEESNVQQLYNLCKASKNVLTTELTAHQLADKVVDVLKLAKGNDADIDSLDAMTLYYSLKDAIEVNQGFHSFVTNVCELSPELLCDDDVTHAKISDIRYEEEYGPPKELGGKKKGDTNEAARLLVERKEQAKDELTRRYVEAKDKASGGNLPKGTYKELHDAVIQDSHLTDSGVSIPQHTIRKRYKNNVKTNNRKRSILQPIEPLIQMFALQKQEARQPLKPSEGIALANSLIEGKPLQDELKAYQASRRKKPTGKVTAGYWRRFMSRSKGILSTAKGYRVGTSKDEWGKLHNVQQMYEMTYDIWVDAGVAVRLPEDEHYWVNEEGERVETEAESAGCKVTVDLIHPEYVIFGDEVGTDVCQEEDGHIGGQTYVTAHGTRAELKSSTNSSRWTLIGLTAATGDPVMCIIIFTGKEIDINTRLGFDHRADVPFDKTKTHREQKGPGKAFPGAPTCTFRGKEVPALVTCTPTGSINSDILMKAFKRLDDLGVYERNEGGPIPCALFDAHDSRLQLPVLRYVNEKVAYGSTQNHRWRLSIGLPNATHIWQVGDSQEQNASYKIAMTREKDALLKWKEEHQFRPVLIESSDIIPLVIRCWDESFGDKLNNIKAIRDRGWNPLDQRLLKNPELLRRSKYLSDETPEVAEANSNTSPTSFDAFNLEDGLAGRLAQDFVQYTSNNVNIQKKAAERYEKAKEAKGRLDNAKKLSGGYMFKAGHLLCDDEVLAMREMKEAKKYNDRFKVIKNAIKTYDKNFDEYIKLTRSAKSPERYNGTDHMIIIRVMRRKSDGPMPKNAPAKKAMYLAVKDREVPTLDQVLLEKGYPREEFEPIRQALMNAQLVEAEEDDDDLMVPVEDDEDDDDDEVEEDTPEDEPIPPLAAPEGNANTVQSNEPSRRSRRGAAVNARTILREALGLESDPVPI